MMLKIYVHHFAKFTRLRKIVHLNFLHLCNQLEEAMCTGLFFCKSLHIGILSMWRTFYSSIVILRSQS